MKKVLVRFLKDYSYKVGATFNDKTKEWEDITKKVKKGEEMELLECVVIRLTANPENVIVEKI